MKKKSTSASRKHDSGLEVPRFTRDEMRRGTLGRYYQGPKLRIVALDDDVARDFPDTRIVNETLRKYREIQKITAAAKTKKTA